MSNEELERLMEEAEFDGVLDVQDVRNGQYNAKACFLKTEYYKMLGALWEEFPQGDELAELIAFLQRRIGLQEC